MTGNLHLIRKQYLHVELDAPESAGFTLQSTLPALCQESLIPAIEKALERCAPANGQLCFDRVELDIGTMALDRLEDDLASSVAQALEKALQELAAVSRDQPQPSSSLPGSVRYKTEQQVINEAFIFFLNTGSLPWSFRLPQGETLEDILLDSRRKTGTSVIIYPAARGALLGVLSSATARKRLVRQFSPLFLEGLLSELAPDTGKILKGLLAALRDSSAPADDKKELERSLWESVFADTAAEYLRGSWRSLPGRAAGYAALATALEQLWPGVTQSTPVATEPMASTGGSPPRLLAVAGGEGTAEGARAASGEQQVASARTLDAEDSPQVKRPAPGAGAVLTIRQGEKYQAPLPESGAAERGPGLCREGLPGWQGEGNEPDAGQLGTAPAKSGEAGCALGKRPPMSRPQYERVFGTPAEGPQADGIYLNQAGLVLLHPFLPLFFEVASGERLNSPERALCLLHYLATGQGVAREYDLVLGKILCGIPLETPVESACELSDVDIEESEGLLKAVIKHWEALRSTSCDGLRGTFLLRPGKVSLREDGAWLLQVESRTCDILLDRLPWGYSPIKLPWMETLLWVEWR